MLYWYSPAARFVAGHFADQIEDIHCFSLDSNVFHQIVLYWHSPAARFVAGHFADQIEDIH